MFGQEKEEPDENPTELVMKKDGEFLHVWGVVDGEEVYHAAPHVQMAQAPIQAAIQTFLSRAYQTEIEELVEQNADSKGVF